MIGGGLARTVVRKAVAAAVAAGAALVAVLCLGAAVFYALCLVLVPLASAAITGLIFAVAALAAVLVFLRGDAKEEDDAEEEPAGLGHRAFMLFRERPVLGAVAALAGGWIFLRNPALASLVAAAFTEKSHSRRRR